MARVPEDHMMIQSEVWTGLVLSCSNVDRCLHKLPSSRISRYEEFDERLLIKMAMSQL